MSSSGFDGSGDMSAPDNVAREEKALMELARLIEEAHAELIKARGQVGETVRLIAELGRISAVFESVAEDLVDATFKASEETTRGISPHAILLSFVDNLGSLAQRAVVGAGDIHREVNRLRTNASPSVGPLQTADAALAQLGQAVQRLSQQRRDQATARRIDVQVDDRSTAKPGSRPRKPSALEEALATGLFVPRGARSGYKN